MKTGTVFWAAGILSLLSVVAGAQSRGPAQNLAVQPPPPPGIAAANWISISGTLGFVVQKANRSEGVPSVSGYFMVKHENLWWRVAPEAQVQRLLGSIGSP